MVHFMDRAFDSVFPELLEPTRDRLEVFQKRIADSFPGAGRFSDLDEADQDAYLAKHDSTAFFRNVRFLTIAGFFGMSKYGGNRDDVGWQLIGMDPHKRAWQSPFGFYDTEYLRGKQDGE